MPKTKFLESVNDKIGNDRVCFTFEGVKIDRSPRPLNQTRHSARFADRLDITDQPRQREFRRREVAGWVHRKDRRRVGRPELRFHCSLVLLRGQTERKASIDIDPSLVSSCPNDDGDSVEHSVLVQRPRLRGNVEAIDHGTPGDASTF